MRDCSRLRDVATARELGLTVVVHSAEQIRLLEVAPAGAAIGTHIKVNSGMNRLGFAPEELAAALERLACLPSVRIEALSMHFANSDRADANEGPVAMVEQLDRFEARLSRSTGAEKHLEFRSAVPASTARGGVG